MMARRTAGILKNVLPRWSPAVYRLVLVGPPALALVVPLALAALPFVEFFNDMAAQPKGKTQMTYGRLYGQSIPVERMPVAGTVPRDHHPYAFEDRAATMEEARNVGGQLPNPLPVTMEHMRAGQRLYNVYCVVCHGAYGEGDGPVIGPHRFPAPPSLHTDPARGYTDGTVFHVITKGAGKMPGYGPQLDPRERWQVIRYCRALQRSRNPRPEDLTP